MKKQSAIAILLFVIGVLVFTRMDFLINSLLYNYGLRFSQNWYVQYTGLYLLCYQLLILSLFAYSRNFKFLLLTEVFVLTCTQDLIYFGLWQGAFPTAEWTWMPFFNIFGTWTTTYQLLLSFSTNIIAALVVLAVSLSRRRATSWLKPPINSYARQ
jgi:hypothetical protein